MLQAAKLQNSMQGEAYSEPYKRFKLQFLKKIVHGFEPKGVFRAQQNNYDEAFCEKKLAAFSS